MFYWKNNFFNILEEERKIITSKQNSKQAKEARTLAWNNIKVKVENNTGKVFEVKKLQKKWNNIQQRVKERNRLVKKTGGSPPVKGSANDEIAERIMGETNPKLVCVPGTMENGQNVSLRANITSHISADDENCINNNTSFTIYPCTNTTNNTTTTTTSNSSCSTPINRNNSSSGTTSAIKRLSTIGNTSNSLVAVAQWLRASNIFRQLC